MSEIAILNLPASRGANTNATPVPLIPDADRKPLTKKEISADHPTWCPGCGDFSVLALYFKLIEKRKMHHEKITTVAGIGCSSRFPYFVQAHGAHCARQAPRPTPGRSRGPRHTASGQPFANARWRHAASCGFAFSITGCAFGR